MYSNCIDSVKYAYSTFPKELSTDKMEIFPEMNYSLKSKSEYVRPTESHKKGKYCRKCIGK